MVWDVQRYKIETERERMVCFRNMKDRSILLFIVRLLRILAILEGNKIRLVI